MKDRLCVNVIDGKRCNDPKRYHKRGVSAAVAMGGMCARGWRNVPAADGGSFWYAYGESGDECSCPGFIAPPKELVRRGNIARKRGAAAEMRRVAGPGRPDLLTEHEAIEVWTHRIPKAWRNKMAQAQRLRSGRTAVLRIEDPADRYALEIVEA